MKKTLFLYMGLLASLALSPPTFAVDSGPEMGSDAVINTSGPAAADIAIQALDEEGNNSMISSEAYGRETVPDPSDHTVFCIGDMKYNGDLMIVSDELVPLAVVRKPERRTCASNVMKDPYNHDAVLATNEVTAAPANLRHSMAWVTSSYLSGSDLRYQS